MKKSGQIGINELLPWFLGLATLTVIVILYVKFSDKGSSIIESLKNLWRFGS
ncbi:MAG: hypothetical protein AABX10_04095 [Nanoarchaeota archaeon]